MATVVVAETVAPRDERVSLRLCIGWGLGTLALGILFNGTATLLMRYLTDYVGLAAAVAGGLISASKVYDALTDPVMGAISDRTRGPLGRRRPWLLLGSFLCAAALIALFNVPSGLGGPLLIAYVALLLLLFATAYTVFGVPYMAMPAEMTADYQERARLISFRVGFSGVSQIAAGYAAPLLILSFGDGNRGHSAMSIVLGAVLFVAGVGCFLLTRGARETAVGPRDQERPSVRAQLRAVAQNRPFVLLIGSKLVLLLAVSSFGATFTYFIVHVLHATYALLGTFTLVSTAAMFISLPVWLKVIRRVNKRRTYIAAAVAYAALNLTWLVAGPGEPVGAVLIRAALMGALGCATLLAGQSLVPDAIEYDWLTNGVRREALFAGFYTMAEKMASAFGIALTGALLGALGYVSTTGGRVVAQPESALLGVTLGVSVVPAVMLLASCVFLLRYDLDPARLERLRAQRAS